MMRFFRRRRLVRARHLALSPMLAAALPAAAQQPDTTRLAPVVVTASRTDVAQHTSPSATTVVTGEALRARGITTVAAALREVTGVTVAQTSSRGSQTSLFLRGGEADYLQVMIDGVTVNEPGGAFSFATLALDDVERIEVVRGPASVLYGSSAVTGVIQIFTRGATPRSTSDLLFRSGGGGLLDVEASMGRGSARRASWWVGAGHHRSDGVHDLNNDWRSSTVTGRFNVMPFTTTAATVTARYSDARYDYPTEYYGAPLDSNSHTTDRRLTLGLNLLHSFGPNIDLRVGAGLNRALNITNDPLDQRTEGFDDGSPTPFENRSMRRSADVQLDLRLIPRSTLTLGGEYDQQELGSPGGDPGMDGMLERWTRAAFAQLAGDLGGLVSYSLGGRLDDNERFGAFETFRAGLGVKVTASTSLRTSAGTAFKEPQFIEITGGGFALPNPSLRPERSRSWEVGIEQRFIGERVALAATYFDQAFLDMIVYAPVPPSQGYSAQYRNAQAADARGWELEARAATARGVAVRANLTDIDAGFRATAVAPAAPLPRRASRSSAVVVTVPVGGRLLITGDHTHTGPRHDVRFFPVAPFSQAERLPSYDLVGIGATYRLPVRAAFDVELLARIDNATDEHYEAVAGFATERRTASLGLRMEFGRR